MDTISTKPIKGFRDFLPEDIKLRTYIFDTWRKIAARYNFDEYDGPVLESLSIYDKSGDDVGSTGKELYKFTDRKGRDLALRPEMTPTVGRLIAEYGSQFTKPIRWYSIAQFFRSEKPQKGRGREFYQLNADIFGDDSINSDIEIIQFCIDIMKAFGAQDNMFKLYINNRKFISAYFSKVLNIPDTKLQQLLIRIIDAYPKNGDSYLQDRLKESFSGTDYKNLYNKVIEYINLDINMLIDKYSNFEGASEITDTIKALETLGLGGFIKYNSTISRGFDYYTGLVFEVFDTKPDNKRSLFGGGRYDDLLKIFGKPKVPAVGVAPGDIPLGVFLQSWNLIPDFNVVNNYAIMVTNLKEIDRYNILKITSDLRNSGFRCEFYLNKNDSLSEQIKYASRKNFRYVAIIGDNEISGNYITLKDLKNFSQDKVAKNDLINYLSDRIG